MAKVFISYSHKDSKVADALYRMLSKQGWDVWSDRKLKVGDDWQEEIEQALRESDYFIFVLTPNSIESQSTNFEMGVALSRQDESYVIPVLLKNAKVPPQLSSLRYLDGRNVDTSKLGEQISQIIKNEESK